MARGPPPSDCSSTPEQTPVQGPGANGAPESDREAGIEQLSRLMLEGWTMLADTCPRTDCHMPLARSRNGRLFCCACQTDVVRAPPGHDPAAPTRDPTSVGATPTAAAAAPVVSAAPTTANAVVAVRGSGAAGPPARRDGGSREAVSAALGEKLLQGWTMLEQACGTCATPLLRGASGTVMCVHCAASAPPPRTSSAAAPSGGGGALPMPPPRPQLPAPAAPERRVESVSAARRALMPPPARAAQPASRASLAPADPADADTYQELCRAEQAAVRALAALRESLAVRRDVDGMASVLQAMREAACTIEALRKARGYVL